MRSVYLFGKLFRVVFDDSQLVDALETLFEFGALADDIYVENAEHVTQ
jgi:hypothetical protein